MISAPVGAAGFGFVAGMVGVSGCSLDAARRRRSCSRGLQRRPRTVVRAVGLCFFFSYLCAFGLSAISSPIARPFLLAAREARRASRRKKPRSRSERTLIMSVLDVIVVWSRHSWLARFLAQRVVRVVAHLRARRVQLGCWELAGGRVPGWAPSLCRGCTARRPGRVSASVWGRGPSEVLRRVTSAHGCGRGLTGV